MSKNLVVTIVVILIVLAAGGYFLVNRSNPQPSISDSQTSVAEPVSNGQRMSIKEFMSMSGSQQCEFSDVESGSSGEVYLAEGKMRGDFSSKVNGDTVNSHMINDGNNIYIWMDNQTTGFKTSLQVMEEMSKEEGMTGVNQTVDLNKQVEYTCQAWSVDEAKFSVPTEIKFQDIGAMMESVGKMKTDAPNSSIPSDAKAAACAACDNLQGEQQDQCKSALKCN